MNLLSFLRSLFSRSPKTTVEKPTVQAELYQAIGERLRVGQRSRVAGTGSMYPTLKGGETFVIEAANFYELKEGQIIIRYDEGRALNIMHRVLYAKYAGNGELYYIVKGDANTARDSNMTYSEFVGVPRFDFPWSHLNNDHGIV